MTSARMNTPIRASELQGRAWLNTGGEHLDLQALRGKIVILDFWSFCCINCLHVLDELRPLEEKYADVLVTIGVHSPKFEHEADPKALEAAIDRYDIEHPVLDDPELGTWQAYTARAWPTLVVVDPEGYIVAHLSGEGHVQGLTSLVDELVAEARAHAADAGSSLAEEFGSPASYAARVPRDRVHRARTTAALTTVAAVAVVGAMIGVLLPRGGAQWWHWLVTACAVTAAALAWTDVRRAATLSTDEGGRG